jgi:hypothetical protein
LRPLYAEPANMALPRPHLFSFKWILTYGFHITGNVNRQAYKNIRCRVLLREWNRIKPRIDRLLLKSCIFSKTLLYSYWATPVMLTTAQPFGALLNWRRKQDLEFCYLTVSKTCTRKVENTSSESIHVACNCVIDCGESSAQNETCNRTE